MAQVWERAAEWASGDDGGGLRAVAVSDELSVEGRGQQAAEEDEVVGARLPSSNRESTR